jgi:cytochrome b561
VSESSRESNQVLRYGNGAIVLHWLMFVLVSAAAFLGLMHDSWPDKTQAFWINIHALVGLTVWIFLIVRIMYRLQHTPPLLPADAGEFSRRVSGPVHFLMYALLFIIPIIGVVTFIWHGRAFDFGLFQVDFGVKKNRAIFNPTEDAHGYLAFALFGLIVIHILAALWHQFIRRDGVMLRMRPDRSAPP